KRFCASLGNLKSERLPKNLGNIEHPTSNTQHPMSARTEIRWMFDVGCSMLDVRCWMFDVGCWMLDVRCWMFDVGCSMLDVRCWMLDVGCWLLDVFHGFRGAILQNFISRNALPDRAAFPDRPDGPRGNRCNGFILNSKWKCRWVIGQR